MDDTKIDLKVSYLQLGTLVDLVEESAMRESNYGVVGLRRELKDYLQRRKNEWKEKINKEEA